MRITTLDDNYVTRHEYMERIGRSDDKMHNLDRRLSKVEELSDKLSDMAVTMQGMLVTLQTMQYDGFDTFFYDATHTNFLGMERIGQIMLNAVKAYE